MTTDAGNTDYLLDNADPRAERRFDALGHLFDTRTIEYLAAIGVTRGWSCWEVGAGGGSIAEWLAGAVAPTGSVLATDLDLGRLSATAMPALTTVRHDVVHDEIPADAYDLVHARLLLVHLPERETVLDPVIRSLRPGGWVVIEDFDNMLLDVGPAATPEQATVRKVALAFKRLLQGRGADLAYARRLPAP
ncbi:MAG TPA: class I SAM-dependent methyltransferase, partial [Gaiellales bacterium]|nr:class I SAM-dependent methyltransferase [Gaiellales bacterium]